MLPQLFAELFPALKSLPSNDYEVLFVNDGSADNSLAMLLKEAQTRPEMVVVALENNFGQHQAIIAGFSVAKGEQVITFDADLQNLPSGILQVADEMSKGHDYVGTIREKRRDIFWRRWLSSLNNKMRERITDIHITDQGCMLRGYSHRITELICATQEASPYLPALGYSFAANPTEITVQHQERQKGESKYSIYKLFRLNFDIMTSYSLVPLQLFSMLGIIVSIASGALFLLLAVRRLLIGPEAEGLFTLFALMFFFIGIVLFGLGILGEYVGRLFSEIRKRPRYLIRSVYSSREAHQSEKKIGRTHDR